MRRWPLLVATIGVAGAVFVGGAGWAGSDDGTATGPDELTEALAEIENLPKYRQSDWGYSVIDQKSGEVLAEQNAQKMFDPGSTEITVLGVPEVRRPSM